MIYGAMGEQDWRLISIDHVNFDKKELQMELIPILSKEAFEKKHNWLSWTEGMLTGCRKALNAILPLRENEKEFFHQLLDHGDLQPDLLTKDAELIQILHSHPLLKWKTQLAIHNKNKLA